MEALEGEYRVVAIGQRGYNLSDKPEVDEYYDMRLLMADVAPPPPQVPRLRMPVLIFHGLADTALHSNGLNNTWDWIDADTIIVAVPGAGHFVQQDAAELVSSTLLWWLRAHAR